MDFQTIITFVIAAAAGYYAVCHYGGTARKV